LPHALPQLSERPSTETLKQALKGRDSASEAYFYDFVALVYEQMGLSRELFARQVGAKPKTVDIWLGRKGHFPSGARLERLLELYEANRG